MLPAKILGTIYFTKGSLRLLEDGFYWMLLQKLKAGRRPFWIAVAIPALVGILLMTLFGVQASTTIGRHYQEEAVQQLQTAAQAVAAAVERELEEGGSALDRLGQAMPHRDLLETYNVASSIGGAFAGWVVLAGREGQRFFNTSRPYGTVLPRQGVMQPFVNAAISSGERGLSGITIGTVNQLPFSSVVVPIAQYMRDPNAEYGAFLLSVPHSRFAELLRRHAPGTPATVLVDALGRVIASDFNATHWSPQARLPARETWAGLSNPLTEGEHPLRAGEVNGQQVVGVELAMTIGGWKAVAIIPRDQYEAAWRTPVKSLLQSSAILTALTLVVAFAISRLVTTPLRRLVKAATYAGSAQQQRLDKPISSFAEFEALRIALIEGAAAIRLQAEAEARVHAAEMTAKSDRAEAQHLQLAQEVGGIGTYSVDFRNQQFYWSQELYRLRGIDPDGSQLTFERLAELIHPEDRPTTLWGRCHDTVGLARQSRFEDEFRAWKEATGEWVKIRAITRVTYSDAGEPETAIGVQMDITERSEAEAQLNATKERLILAQEAAGMGVFSFDLRTGERFWSERNFTIRGLQPQAEPPPMEEVVEAILPEDRHKHLPSLLKAFKWDGCSEKDFRTDYRVRHAGTGDIRWTEVVARVYFDSAGNVTRWVGAVIDVTDKRRTEEEALAAVETFRLAQTASGAAVYERCLRTDVAIWSPERYAMLGFDPSTPPPSRSELRNHIVEEFSSSLSHDAWNYDSKTSEMTDFRAEIAYRHGVTGEVKWVLETGKIIRNPQGGSERLIGISIDITEIRRIQKQLVEGEVRLQFAEELSGFGVFERNVQDGTGLWSKGLLRIWGFEENDVTYLTDHDKIVEMVHADDRDRLVHAISRIPPSPDEIANGRKVNVEFRMRRATDSQERWIHCVAQIYFTAQGTVSHWIGAQVDVTDQRRIVDEVQRNQSRLKLAQDAAGIGFFERDALTGEGIWTEQLFRNRGLDPNGRVPLPEETLKFVLPEDRSNSLFEIMRSGVLESGEPIARVVRIMNAKDGAVKYIRSIWKMITNADGRKIIVGAEIDVDQQMKTEQALRESEARLRLAQKVAGMGVFERDVVTGEGHWSEEMYQMRGYAPGSYVPQLEAMRDDVLEEDQPNSLAAIMAQRQLKTGEVVETSIRLRRGYDREVRRVVFRVTALDGPKGPATKLVGVMMDVTEQAKAVEDLRASEERFRLVAAAMQGGIFDRDLVTGEIIRTDEYHRIIGWAAEDLPSFGGPYSLVLKDFIYPEDAEQAYRIRREALDSGAPSYYLEYRVRTKKDECRYLATYGVIVRNADGKPIRTVGSVIDITARREAENALRASEERLRLAQENAGIGVFEINYLEKTRTWSPELFRMFGMEPVDPVTAWDTVTSFAVEEDRHLTTVALLSQPDAQEHQTVRTEYRGRHTDGSIRHFLSFARGFWDEKGNITKIIGVQLDITDLKHAESEARRHAEVSRLSLAAARAGFWEMDVNSGKLHWSQETYALFGLDPDQGEMTLDGWVAQVHPEDREAGTKAVNEILTDPMKDLRVEYRVVKPDGSIAWLLAMGRVELDKAGQPRLMRGIVFDVTERREAERAQSLLMREVDHRAKNALASVLPIIRLTKAATFDKYIESVEARVSALGRAHELLARNRWSGASLRSLLEEEVGHYVDSNKRVRFTGRGIRIAAHAVQGVSMLLHELATNAAKYGALSMETGNLHVSWEMVPHGGQDNGPGLLLTWRERGGPEIVSPPTHQGFGSTLIEQTVTSQLDGTAEAEWHPDGVEWRFFLPDAFIIPGNGPEGEKPQFDIGESDKDGAPSSVLVVEDEAMIALVMAETMIQANWDVVGPASSLTEAMELFESRPDIGLAVLDVNLKGEMVFPLAHRLREKGVPIIFTTGYGDHVGLNEFRDTCPVLTKPVLPSEIITVAAGMVRTRGVLVDA